LRLRKPVRDLFSAHFFDAAPHSVDLGRELSELRVPNNDSQVRSLPAALQVRKNRIENVHLHSSEGIHCVWWPVVPALVEEPEAVGAPAAFKMTEALGVAALALSSVRVFHLFIANWPKRMPENKICAVRLRLSTAHVSCCCAVFSTADA